MTGTDWQELVCIAVVIAACGGVIWYIWRGGW